jgi:hypothetical protein
LRAADFKSAAFADFAIPADSISFCGAVLVPIWFQFGVTQENAQQRHRFRLQAFVMVE